MQHSKTPQQQRGATTLGMLVIVAIVGLGLYAVIRLAPVYIEYFAVVGAMEAEAKEGGSIDKVRQGLNRRWNIEDIKTVKWDEIDVYKNGEGISLNASYRAEVPFIANVSLVVDFDKTVDSQ